MMNQFHKINDRVIRGALLGTGQVAKFQMSAWSKIPDVKIVALANRTIERALTLADQYELEPGHVYSDYRDLLANEPLDFVDIATAPEIHHQQVLEAAGRGIHVLCQKPFASSLEEAEEMVRAANRAGILLSVNENWRWRGWYRDIKEMLLTGVIGNPSYFRIERRYAATLDGLDGEPPTLLSKQSYTKDMNRLIVYEWGIHLLDIIRFLFGDIKSVYSRMQHVSPYVRGEDRAVIVASADGVDCVVDISWASLIKLERFSQLEYVVIEGSQGTIELLPNSGDIIRVTTRKGVVERPAFSGSPEIAYQSSYDAAQSHFIECLKNGKDPETVATDNIKTLRAVFASYESVESNQVIKLNE